MAEVHQRPPGRKGRDPSVAVRNLEAFVGAARVLLKTWDGVLEGTAYPACIPSFDAFVDDLDEWLDSVDELHTIETSDIAPLDFTNPKMLRDWLNTLDSTFHDLLGAADDATRPLGRRELGRATARARVLEARHSLRHLLEAATRGAPPVPK